MTSRGRPERPNSYSVRLPTLSNPLLRCGSGPLVLVLALAWPGGPAGAQTGRDPFDVRSMRPAAPSDFWEGPRGACSTPVKVPQPLRLGDAVDLALCNNPLTRES